MLNLSPVYRTSTTNKLSPVRENAENWEFIIKTESNSIRQRRSNRYRAASAVSYLALMQLSFIKQELVVDQHKPLIYWKQIKSRELGDEHLNRVDWLMGQFFIGTWIFSLAFWRVGKLLFYCNANSNLYCTTRLSKANLLSQRRSNRCGIDRFSFFANDYKSRDTDLITSINGDELK